MPCIPVSLEMASAKSHAIGNLVGPVAVMVHSGPEGLIGTKLGSPPSVSWTPDLLRRAVIFSARFCIGFQVYDFKRDFHF